MIALIQRQHLVSLIEHACHSGARLHKACQLLGLSCRTVQRWLRPASSAQGNASAVAPLGREEPQATIAPAGQPRALTDPVPTPPTPVVTNHDATVCATTSEPIAAPIVEPIRLNPDRRQAGLRRAVTPHNKLTDDECAAIMTIMNSHEFKDLPPSQIVPRLADQGLYLASESTFQRLLRHYHQHTHRRSERAPQRRHKPKTHIATQINQVYSWDITYLPTQVKGQYYYLYLFVDIFSRFIVGAYVFASESADLAAQTLKEVCLQQGVQPGQVTLHSDNGSSMKGQTMLAMMQALGVEASRSRPSVSNDNPYSESLFRTLKYRPLMPVRPFESIDAARQWANGLVTWYNYEHRHSAINFVTPAQRHAGQDADLLSQRSTLYAHARAQHPNRWSRHIRKWARVTTVFLNPDKPPLQESQ